MTENELAAEIKADSISGIYFFFGEEDYLKNHRASEIRKLICGDETLAAFNYIPFTFGDAEINLSAVSDALLAPPIMSDKKIVDIYFASLDSIKERDKTSLLDLLREFSENDSGNTVVLIRAAEGGFDPGQPKKPSSFLRDALKFMKTVRFEYQPTNRLHRWMERHFAQYGLTISPYVSEQIIDLAGRSMYRLIGEIGKTAAYAAENGRSEVLPSDVTACVSRTDEDDAFGLANCVLEGNTAGALEALAVKMRRRDEPIFLLTQITKVFSDLSCAAAFIFDGREKGDYARTMKMHEYKAGLYYRAAKGASFEYFADIMRKCAEADLAMKSGLGGGDYSVIERLICSCAISDAEKPAEVRI